MRGDMDESDELIQVNVTVGDSVLELLPEMMRTLTNARNSTYSWHSMNVSLYSKNNMELALNLTKDTSDECETIKGRLLTVNDSQSLFGTPQVLAEICMSGYRDKTMRDYLNEISKPPKCASSSITASKVLSNEVFYPSWYDRVRMVSDSAVLGSMIPPSITISTINLHNYVSNSSNNEKQELLSVNERTHLREPSDDTLRLKKIRERVHKSIFKPADIAALEEVSRLHSRVLSNMSCNAVQFSRSSSPLMPNETIVTNKILEFNPAPIPLRRKTSAVDSTADGDQNYQWYYCCDGLTDLPQTGIRNQDTFTVEKVITLDSDSEESKLSFPLIEKNQVTNTDEAVGKRTISTNVVTWLMNNDLHRMVENDYLINNLETNKMNKNKTETEEMDLLGRGDSKKLDLIPSEEFFNHAGACGDSHKRDKRRYHRSDKRKKKEDTGETQSVKIDLKQKEHKTKYPEDEVTSHQKFQQGHRLLRKDEKSELSGEHIHLHREGKYKNKRDKIKKSKIPDNEHRHRDHDCRESPSNELQHKEPKSPVVEKECKKNTKSINEHKSVDNINKNEDRSKWKKFVIGKKRNGVLPEDDMQDESTSSAALSFLELVSIMKSEVRQLGRKKKEDKRNRCKDT